MRDCTDIRLPPNRALFLLATVGRGDLEKPWPGNKREGTAIGMKTESFSAFILATVGGEGKKGKEGVSLLFRI